MADEKLPAIGTRAVHKDQHANGTGPMWEVVSHNLNSDTNGGKPIHLNHAKHKLNTGVTPPTQPVKVSATEFNDNYVQM